MSVTATRPKLGRKLDPPYIVAWVRLSDRVIDPRVQRELVEKNLKAMKKEPLSPVRVKMLDCCLAWDDDKQTVGDYEIVEVDGDYPMLLPKNGAMFHIWDGQTRGQYLEDDGYEWALVRFYPEFGFQDAAEEFLAQRLYEARIKDPDYFHVSVEAELGNYPEAQLLVDTYRCPEGKIPIKTIQNIALEGNGRLTRLDDVLQFTLGVPQGDGTFEGGVFPGDFAGAWDKDWLYALDRFMIKYPKKVRRLRQALMSPPKGKKERLTLRQIIDRPTSDRKIPFKENLIGNRDAVFNYLKMLHDAGMYHSNPDRIIKLDD